MWKMLKVILFLQSQAAIISQIYFKIEKIHLQSHYFKIYCEKKFP